jgi:hypothetical protein
MGCTLAVVQQLLDPLLVRRNITAWRVMFRSNWLRTHQDTPEPTSTTNTIIDKTSCPAVAGAEIMEAVDAEPQ